METEEGEEMEVAADVVMIPIRDRSEETKSVSPQSTKDGVTLIKIAKRQKEEMEMKSCSIVMSVVCQRTLRES